MISYEPFWNTLKEKNITIYHLIHKNGINSNTINRIKKNASITTYTLDHLCHVLGCAVQDIITYTPDTDEDNKTPQLCYIIPSFYDKCCHSTIFFNFSYFRFAPYCATHSIKKEDISIYRQSPLSFCEASSSTFHNYSVTLRIVSIFLNL